MALKVWLPLNGNLNNQGIESIVLSSGSPTYVDGKIGQCLGTGTITFDTKNNLITNISANKQYTVGAWCKNIDISAANRWVYGLGSGTGSMRGFYESGSTTTRHWAFSGSGSNCSTNINMLDGNWHHIMFTVNGSTVTLYMDGQKQGTTTDNTVALANEKITLYASNYNINDFRLYDECLSDKQIKEIAKGLIAHYKMDEPRPNLVKGNYYARATSTQKDSAGDILLNLPSGMTLNNLIGKTLTFSYYYCVEGDRKNNTGNWQNDRYGIHGAMTIKNASGTSQTIYPFADNLEARGTGRAIMKYTVPSDIQEITAFTFSKQDFNAPAAENPATWYLRDAKLEIGDGATDYCENFSSLSYDARIKDYSGYDRHGTRTGEWSSQKSEARYNRCLFAESTNSGTNTATGIAYMKAPLALAPITALTINWWSKIEKYDFQNSGILCLSDNSDWPGDYQTGTINQYDSNFLFHNSSGTGKAISAVNLIVKNEWHMYTLTFDGSNIKSYRDGILQQTAALAGPLKNCNYLFLGVSRAGGVFRQVRAQYSDFRIYVTAFNENEILTLYKNSAIIDNKGVMESYSFEETDARKIVPEQTLFTDSGTATVTKVDSTGRTFTVSQTASSTNGGGVGFAKKYFQNGGYYKMSCYVRKNSGTLNAIGGHSSGATILGRYIDGKYRDDTPAAPISDNSLINDGLWHYYELYFTYKADPTDLIYLQINRKNAAQVAVEIQNLIIEKLPTEKQSVKIYKNGVVSMRDIDINSKNLKEISKMGTISFTNYNEI